jgi:serine/threonine protein kinase
MQLQIHNEVGPYHIIDEIAPGGMGMVYKAKDKFGKLVALKVIKDQDSESNRSKRFFMQEAEITQMLDHKNVIKHYKHGVDKKQDLEYLALEYAKNKSLADYIENFQNISTEIIIKYLQGIANGLDYIHKKGVIHRDLKPGNILLDENYVPKIADFGLAKKPNDKIFIGAIGLGTRLYMAPEQMRDSDNVTASADIYSFAAVAYTLFTRFPPYHPTVDTKVRELGVIAVVVQGASKFEILKDNTRDFKEFLGHIQVIPPIAPSELNPSLPKDVDAVIYKGMHPTPEERYSTANEFVQDLNNALNKRSTLAGKGTNEVLDLDAPITEQERKTWSRAGRSKMEKLTEAGLWVGLAIGTAQVMSLFHDRIAKEQRLIERFRVYRDISETITGIFEVSRSEAYLLTLEMIESLGNTSDYFPSEVAEPTRTLSVSDVTAVIKSIRLTYKNNLSWKDVPVHLDIYTIENGQVFCQSAPIRELQWREVPSDIRQDMLEQKQDITYKLYP